MNPDDRGPTKRAAPRIIVVAVVGAATAVLLIPVLRTANTVGPVRITSTTACIEGISVAVDQYKQLYNAYPPDRSIPPFGLHADLDQSSECLVYFLSGASICYDSSTYPDYRWAHSLFDLNRLGAGRDVKIVFYTFRWNTLTDADDDRIPEVVDAWGTPLLYNVSSPTHNRGKFDLSSAGPDKRFGTKDDIENWDD